MVYLLLSVVCSSLIIISFRYFGTFSINNLPAIVVNYFTCVAIGLTLIFFNASSTQPVDVAQLITEPLLANWRWYAVVLGILFIVGFNLIAKTTQYAGITAASIASKTTLVLPVGAAFLLYGDTVSFVKLFGVVLAVPAVVLSALPASTTTDNSALADVAGSSTDSVSLWWLFPLGAFLVGGCIEILLNYVQVHYIEPDGFSLFLIYLFGIAGCSGLLLMVYQWLKKQLNIQPKDVLAGVILGIPNYGSIYFLLQCLEKSQWQSSVVFPINNMGIVIASSLSAFILFKEKLTRLNFIGLAVAVVAILLIAVG